MQRSVSGLAQLWLCLVVALLWLCLVVALLWLCLVVALSSCGSAVAVKKRYWKSDGRQWNDDGRPRKGIENAAEGKGSVRTTTLFESMATPIPETETCVAARRHFRQHKRDPPQDDDGGVRAGVGSVSLVVSGVATSDKNKTNIAAPGGVGGGGGGGVFVRCVHVCMCACVCVYAV